MVPVYILATTQDDGCDNSGEPLLKNPKAQDPDDFRGQAVY